MLHFQNRLPAQPYHHNPFNTALSTRNAPIPFNLQQPIQIQQPVKVQQTHLVPIEGMVTVQNHFGQPLTVKLHWQQLQKIIHTIENSVERIVKRL